MDFRNLMVSDRVTKTIIEKPDGIYTLNRPQKYVDFDLGRVEMRNVTTESDFINESHKRFSSDNGKTWTSWQKNDQHYKKRGEMEMLEYDFAFAFSDKHKHILKLVMRRIFRYEHKKVYEKYWGSGQLDWHDTCSLKVSKDNGKTWMEEYPLSFEPGDAFRVDDWTYGNSLETNRSYAGNTLWVDEKGSVLIPLSCAYSKKGQKTKNSLGEVPKNGLHCFKGLFDETSGRYDFQISEPVIIESSKSSRGLTEPNIIKLKSGRILFEARGSNAVSKIFDAKMAKGTPGYRWIALSDDDGKTFSQIKPLGYTDGTYPMSSASKSKIIRSQKNGKTYWIGNLTDEIPNANHPRAPLFMIEIDEESGKLNKDSAIVIDKKHPEDSPKVQLSNFTVLDDKESGNIEIYLTRLGANEKNGHFWKNAAVKYTVNMS